MGRGQGWVWEEEDGEGGRLGERDGELEEEG